MNEHVPRGVSMVGRQAIRSGARAGGRSYSIQVERKSRRADDVRREKEWQGIGWKDGRGLVREDVGMRVWKKRSGDAERERERE